MVVGFWVGCMVGSRREGVAVGIWEGEEEEEEEASLWTMMDGVGRSPGERKIASGTTNTKRSVVKMEKSSNATQPGC